METMPYLAIRSAASLIVLERGFVRNYPLDAKNLWRIGRKNPETENDIELESKIVSRKHGYIQNIDGEWYYVESGSLNGTYYNGKKIAMNENSEYEAVKLSNGDILRVDSDNLENPEERGVLLIFTTEGIGNQWKTITLRKAETVFGRNAECDVTIPLSYISARHMVVRKKEAEYFLMDCDSMAGTWVNGQEVHGEVPLKEKDTISICDCTMILTENKIIYNIPVIRKNKSNMSKMSQNSMEENNLQDRPVVLEADIKSKKVKNNQGFGKKELIRDIKVEIREGTLVALIGGTGAGKSTVMNCLNGYETNGIEGNIKYKGVDLIKDFNRMKYLIGNVQQGDAFHEELTVEQELTNAAGMKLPRDTSKKEIADRVNMTLKQLGIENVRKNQIAKCSGGERRRVNIGIELVADRQLLCLDEPDAGLDPGNKKKLYETLRNLAHNEEKSILTIIHDVSEIDLFDQMLVLNKVDNVGRLAFMGTPQEARKYFETDEIKDVYDIMEKNPGKYIFKGDGTNE